jgi:hypothetical protein
LGNKKGHYSLLNKLADSKIFDENLDVWDLENHVLFFCPNSNILEITFLAHCLNDNIKESLNKFSCPVEKLNEYIILLINTDPIIIFEHSVQKIVLHFYKNHSEKYDCETLNEKNIIFLKNTQ